MISPGNPARLILASKSATRQDMLRNAGVDFTIRPAHLDERAIEARMAGASAEAVALALAEAKALAVAEAALPVLGSDSLVVVDGKRFDKPDTREEAAEHLAFFSGRVMELHAAAAIAMGGEQRWSGSSVAFLHVRRLNKTFIEKYLDAEWPAVSHCVGVFRIEALGVQLFEQIQGDTFTVLGMPLIPVLGALRDLGVMDA